MGRATDRRMARLWEEVVGAGDTALAMLSPMAGDIAGGWAGILSGDPGAVRPVQDAFAYQPRTEAGRRNLGVLGQQIQNISDFRPTGEKSVGELGGEIGDYWRDRSVPALQWALGDEAGAAAGAGLIGIASVIGAPRKVGALGPESRRISTRMPTAVKAAEDPFRENLIINTTAMQDNPKAFTKNMALMSSYPQLSSSLRNPDRRAQYALGVMSDNLVDMYERIPPDIRDKSKQWYVGANRFSNQLADRYGHSPESTAGVLAALSPQKDWYMNASLAERLIDANDNPGIYTPDMDSIARQIFRDQKFEPSLREIRTKPYESLTPEQKAMYVRIKDETENYRGHRILSPEGDILDFAKTNAGVDKKTGWGSVGEIAKGIGVLEDPSIENISKLMGGMHKVRNFFNNINAPFDPYGDVTIDTHAVAAALLSPFSGNSLPVTHNFGGTGSASIAGSGARGTYGLYADAYRDAANRVGVLPREMQSITWEGVRGLFPAAFKTGKNVQDIAKIWEDYKRGGLTIDQARDEIYGRAGGIAAPDWARSGSGYDAGTATSTYKGGVPGNGVSGALSSGVDSGAGGYAAGSVSESGFVDPELIRWLALLGGGALAGGALMQEE